jgi:UDP-2,3-diacylglucosamine pyrophosphatase LpxH
MLDGEELQVPEVCGPRVSDQPLRGEHDLLIVSDLHLTLSLDDEDTATDAALATFLDHHRQHRRRGRPWRLVMAGDIFEFVYPDMVHFIARYPGPDAPERDGAGFLQLWPVQALAWRLRVTMRERSPVFLALGRFLAAGNRLELIKGNHDVELQWAAVQRGFLETMAAIMAEAGEAPEPGMLEAAVDFHVWFYYEPGRVYVEHGNQYDEFNCLPNFLDPALVTDPNRSFSPMGSRLTTYMTNAFVDYKPRPEAGAFMHYLEQTGQKWSRKYIGRSLTVLYHSVIGSGMFSEEGWQAGSGRQDEGLLAMEQLYGIPLETLEELQALQSAPVTAQRGWVINRFGLDRVAVVLFGLLMVVLGLIFGLFPITEPALLAVAGLGPVALIVGVLLRLKLKKGRRHHKWIALVALVGACVVASLLAPSATLFGGVLVTYAVFVTTYAFLILPLTNASDLHRHLVITANRVGRLLDVPVVVFGHHHRPIVRELQDDRRYINCGAWANCGDRGGQAWVRLWREANGEDQVELCIGPADAGGET